MNRLNRMLTLAVGFSLLAVGAMAQEAAPNAENDADRLILSVPVTYSDWMLRDGVAWGPEGVHHMLDMCKAGGWSKVYWRALDGGRSLYKSDLMDPQGKWEDDNFWHPLQPDDIAQGATYWGAMTEADRAALLAKIERYNYAEFDSLAEAVRYGHEIGLEVHAWISINEDDHAWGIQSRFTKSHPDSRWRKRDGTFYRSQQSFAFPEVMEYKLGIVKEILDRYAVDGLFLDWIRTGDVRDNPQTDAEGVADHGYETPVIEGFKAKFGVDPHDIPNSDERWVLYRAEPHTAFMRQVRTMANAKRAGLPVTVLVAHPWCYRGHQNRINGSLNGLLLDVRTWAREGLIDAAVAAGYYLDGGSASTAYQALKDETGANVDVWYFGWVPGNADAFMNDFSAAQKLGARQILFWEGDYIDGNPDKAAVQEVMRRHASGLNNVENH